MRHGEASFIADSDQARALTEKGKKQAFTQGIKLQVAHWQFDHILVSPYLRAQQTFEQINAAFQGILVDKIETWQEITPYGNASAVSDYLRVLATQNKQSILLISHLPLVSDIVFKLAQSYSVSFHPATIAEICYQNDLGQLVSVYNA